MINIKSKDIVLIDVDKVIANPKNTNKHSQDQIKRLEKLIKHNGFRDPLIISNRSGFSNSTKRRGIRDAKRF